jgi:hypothetical protein
MAEALPTWDAALASANKPPTWDEALKQAPAPPGPPILDAGMSGGVPTGPEFDQVFALSPAGHMLKAFGQGAEAAVTAPLTDTDEARDFLTKAGILGPAQESQGAIGKAFHDAIVRPAAAAAVGTLGLGEVAMHVLSAPFAGAEAAVPALAPEIEAITDPGLQATVSGMGPPGAIAAAGQSVLRALALPRSLGVIGEGEAGWEGDAAPTAVEASARAEAIRRLAPPQPEATEAPGTAGTAPSAALPEATPIAPTASAVAPAPDIHAIARRVAPDVFNGPRGYDALTQRRDTLARWMGDLRTARDTAATADIDRQISEAQGRLETETGRRAATWRDRLETLTEQRATALEEVSRVETADMARVRRDYQATDYAMRDLAPAVSAAYREAEARVGVAQPEEVPAIERPEAVAAIAPLQEETIPAAATEQVAVEPPATAETQVPAINIANDVAKQLVSAGRPAEEADATGTLVDAMYRAWSARYPGLGSPEALYAREAPSIVAGRAYAMAQSGRELGQNTVEIGGHKLPLNEDGTVTLYHATKSSALADKIINEKTLRSQGEPAIYLSTEAKGTGYGDHVVEIKIDPSKLELDDEFPSGRLDFRVKGKRIKVIDASRSALEQPRRGSITLKQGRSIIRLMKDADASTAIHEFGHDQLDKLMNYAQWDNAPADLKQDAATVRQWLGAEEGKEIPTRAHEKFARGFERYLMEGIAPTQRLASVFAKFKQWMLDIYKTVARLRAPINDDIRGVFNRMLMHPDIPEHAIIAAERETPLGMGERHMAIVEEAIARARKAVDLYPINEQIQREADEFARLHGYEEEAGIGAATGGKPHGGGAARQFEPGPARGGAPARAIGAGANEGAAQEPGVGATGAGGRQPGGDRGGGPGGGATGGLTKRSGGLTPSEQPLNAHAPIPAVSEYVDKAGNIRLDNLNESDDVKNALRDLAMQNQDFMPARGGVVSDAERRAMADGLGLKLNTFVPHKPVDVSPSVWAEAVQKLTFQATDAVAKAGQVFGDSGALDDWINYQNAKTRLLMVANHFAETTAEAGRTLRVFNKAGLKFTQDIIDRLEDDSGRTLAQAQREAKAVAILDTTAKRAKFMQDSLKPDFWDMFIEYFVNNLISGLATHITYSIGNTMLALAKAVPETALQASIGAFREHVLGRAEPRVYFGEIGAQLKAMGRTGLPFVTAAKLAHIIGHADTWEEAGAQAYALMRGSRDGIMAAARAAIDGTTAPLPGEGIVRGMSTLVAPRRAIPGMAGEAIRLPSRGVAIIHSYFRAVGYEQNVARLAYRKATSEGLTGEAFARRVGDLTVNTPEDMMREAAGESTMQTMMGKGGDITRALSAISNKRILGMPIPKLINPFVHIVGNVMEQGLLERTPLAFTDEALRANLLGHNGPIAQSAQISRVMFGTAVGLTGFGMAMEGLQNGSGPVNPRQAALYRRVKGPPNSTRIGDWWYDFHRLGSVEIPFRLGANIYETAHLMGTEDFAHAIAQVAFGFSQTILDESAMTGPSEFIQAMQDPIRYGGRYVRNLFTSALIPYSVGMSQEAHAIDPYARRVTSMTEALKAKTPWWSETLFPMRDWTGEPIPSRESLGMDGLSAIYEEKARNDPVEQEMLRLGFYPALPKKTIRGVTLTEQQYDDFSRISGRLVSMRLRALITSPGWPQIPDSIKHETIVKTAEQAREQARNVIMMQSMGSNNDIVNQAVQAKLKAMAPDMVAPAGKTVH